MPEIRELILQDHMGSSLFRLPGWGRLASKLKLTLRRIVVATSVWPLDILYAAIYKLHVSYAVRILKRLPKVRAVYLIRGAASAEIVFGVSDIDMIVFGDWSGEEHEQAMQTLRRLCHWSPLYDRTLWLHAHTVEAMHNLYETDFYYQFRFDQGREWKLLCGENIIAALKPVPPGRIAGGYYMDMRNWWGTFHESAFAFGVTAGDAVFRNSIAFKTVGEMLSKADALQTGKLENSRRKVIDRALTHATGADRDFLDRLKRSSQSRHLKYDGDIQDDTWRFLLRLLENFHASVAGVPPFDPMPNVAMHLDAAHADVLRTSAAETHARGIVDHARREWPGYRAAFLVPSVSLFNLDDLMLLLEVDPSKPPTVRQVRDLCRMHIAARPRLRQRIVLLLLLPEGAYQLETVSLTELWHLVMCPSSNPDLFALLNNPDFLLDGSPRTMTHRPPWTRFAAALIDEELGVRRAAMSNVNADPSIPSLDLARNLYRHIQLEIVQRSTSAGHALIPLTPAAIERALQGWGLPDAPVLRALRRAYEDGLEGKPADVHALLPDLMALFGLLQ